MEILYNIQKTNFKISDFISWAKRDNLILSPSFQRRAVWKTGTKSLLIDTIVKNYPIPIIFLRDLGTDPKTFEPKREVVDGQQRLRTIISFIAPELLQDYSLERDNFSVQKNHNSTIAGKKFADLDPELQQIILNYEFSVHVLPPNIDDRSVIEIFRRMNSTNTPLKKQELINSQYFGEFKTSVYSLSSEQLQRWRKWKTFSEDDIARMLEVELTSELIITILTQQISGRTSTQIEQFYKQYDKVYPNKEVIEQRFRDTMDFIYNNFPGTSKEFVFYKVTLFYTFFSYIYDLLYGFDSSIIKKLEIKKIPSEIISMINKKSNLIKEREAPPLVLESSSRRTTNPKERKILFNYLREPLL